MTTRRFFAKSILAAALAAGVGGVAAAQPMPAYPPRPYPPAYPPGWRAPPPLRYEAVPPPPGPAYAWVPGHWRWNGYRYFWVSGRYVYRQPGWHRWIDGRWVVVNGRWTWIPGHWT